MREALRGNKERQEYQSTKDLIVDLQITTAQRYFAISTANERHVLRNLDQARCAACIERSSVPSEWWLHIESIGPKLLQDTAMIA